MMVFATFSEVMFSKQARRCLNSLPTRKNMPRPSGHLHMMPSLSNSCWSKSGGGTEMKKDLRMRHGRRLSTFSIKKFRVQFNRQQMKSRMNVLKKDYRILKAIHNESGFSWDRTSLTVTAIDEVWDDYVLTHPDTKKFRKISLPHYGDLCQLFEDSYAGGKEQPSIVRPNLSENGASTDVTTIPVMEQPARTPPTYKEDNKGSVSNSEKAVPSRSSECNKRLAMSGVARREKRMRLNVGNRIVDCMQSLVLQSEQLDASKREPTTNEDSYYKCLEELQELEGLNQSDVLRAVDIPKDSMNMVAFRALKADIRLEWLKVQCCKF